MAPPPTGTPGSPRYDLTKEIMEVRLRYDLANNECKQIQNRRSQIRERATGFVNTEDLSADADEDAAEIAQLEADIELTGVQYYEAWETRKTYEQVIKRLKYEASTYPKELEALDRTEHAKDHDYESMRLMLKDANHVKDMANKELAKVDEGLAQERRERERDLQARRRKMQLKQEAAAAHERRVAARRKALYKEKEDVMERMGMVGSNLTPLKSSSRLLKSSQSDLIQSERDMIAQYEAQFAQIKEVAGADGVEEVIEVFSAQEAMHKMLAELSSASQLRIDALQSQRAEAEARVAIEHLSNIVTTTAQLPLLAGSPRRSPSSPAATVGQSAVSDAELAQQLRDATAQLDLLFGEVAQHNEGHSPLAMRRQLPRPATFSTLLHPSEAGPPQGPQDELAGEAEARVLDRDYSMLGLNLEPRWLTARVRGAAQEGGDEVPIFKLSGENMRIDSPTDPLDNEEEDDDPENPTEPVMDRETVKKNARLLLKKKTAPHRRPVRRKGRGGGGGGDDDDAPAASPGAGRPTTAGSGRPATGD